VDNRALASEAGGLDLLEQCPGVGAAPLPALLAEASVIATLEESALDGSRVWEPSREHGYHALRHFYASEQLEAGESVVSLARWLGHSDPGFTLRKYAHFLPRAGARGSATIDAVFALP
jgi:hypothetical protein